MCRQGRNSDSNELSRYLGERGDYVACLTSQIGLTIERGQDVSPQEIQELERTLDEIEGLVEDVKTAGRVAADGDGRASAD